ncbi:MAG: hypothetical protein ABIP44_12565 [Pseudoxanthomonas sp.]
MYFAKMVVFGFLVIFSGIATAAESSEKLSKCLLSSTTLEDKQILIRWIFGAVANHPDVSDIATLSPEKWDDISKKSAHVFQKLIAESCANESRDAIINDGMEGYKSAFATLGSAAVGGLMSDPSVVQAMGKLDTYLDSDKLMKALMTGESQRK